MFVNANKWRIVLCCGRPSTTWMGSSCCLYENPDPKHLQLNGKLILDSGLTGWSNWMGQVTGAPSVDYAMAAMILAGASITHPDYVPTNWQTFLLTTLIMLIHGCISSMPTKWIANFNSVGSTFNIIALCIVLILIPASTNRGDQVYNGQQLPKFAPASEVWGNFYDGTDFPNGVALLMTFVAVIWTMR